jgi:prepilin-type N-terminal cleavage/methylation domain-containing protein
VRRAERGFTLIEVVYVLAVFGAFLYMLTVMTEELRRQEPRYPIDFMQHPQITAVMSRLRRDVIDASLWLDPDTGLKTPMYPANFMNYRQSKKTLIVYTIMGTGFGQTVVWDFSNEGRARRTAYSVGIIVSDWMAGGVPQFEISTYEIPNRPFAVRFQARDRKGNLAIDQIFQPRTHE